MGATCAVAQALSYFGPEGPYNFEMTARMLLNGDLGFCAIFNFNDLHVAKIAH
jgi:hypothetical protein